MGMSFGNRLAIAITSIGLPASVAVLTWRASQLTALVAGEVYDRCQAATGYAPAMAGSCAVESQRTAIAAIEGSKAIRWANGLLYLTIAWFAVLAIYMVWSWVSAGRRNSDA
jgi:hypothetical protein